jgi:cyclic-di-AMP phosphodiesterase PgpH
MPLSRGRESGPGPTWLRGLRDRIIALRKGLSDRTQRLLEIRWVWSLIFLVALTPLILVPRIGAPLPTLAPGSLVPEDIIAPATREFVDDAATREVREAAGDAILPVYDLDTRSLQDALDATRLSFQDGRAVLAALARPGSSPSQRDRVRALKAAPEVRLPASSLDYLARAGFDPAIEERIERALREVFRHRIVGSRALLPHGGPVTVRDMRTGREWKEEGLDGFLSIDQARQLALATLRDGGASAQERAALGPYLADLVTPTLLYDGALTEERRQEAAARIDPLMVRIPKGRVLLRRGEVVSEDAARTITALNAARAAGASGRVILGNLLLMALLLFFMSRYVFFYQQSYRREQHLLALMVVVTVLGLFLDQGFVWLYENLVDTLRVAPFDNPSFYRYMVPMAVGAMLMTLLANARVGMAYALFYVPLFGMMMEWDLPLLLFCLVSNLAAIYGISTYRRRSALILSGLVLGAINAVAVLALQSVIGGAAPFSHLLFQMFCGLVGGILVAVLASFLLPVLEALFNILTDVRLLELSNLNNPLLRRLAVEAPGSYNHSVIVGTLAEAAAESIGANALFCRVAAYYHDVGKMLKPDYFIENQKDGVNRHDRLSPRMSALVIASHVKDGYELARSYGLPKQVLEIIPQHHGTRKINYFYQKAKRAENPEMEEIQESDFRYPGPRPQTREAAIFMLSDSIEAAARTLDDPSPARFKGLIRKIVSDVVLDDQFDQCDLTFSDLERVSAAFLRTLSSIYHNRIDYPGFEFDRVTERPFRGSRTHEDLPPSAKGWGR